MSFFNPFGDALHSNFELRTHPFENFGTKTVRSIPACVYEDTIHAFHNLICLEVMRCYACGIHRILKNFVMRLDVIKILCCAWTLALQACQGPFVFGKLTKSDDSVT